MKLRRFTIGCPVLVRAVLRSGFCWFNDKGEPLDPVLRVFNRKTFEPAKLGWIVGASRRYEGKRMPPVGECQGYLDVTRTIPVWLVRFGLANREEAVLDEDTEAAEYSYDITAPIYANPAPLTPETRAELREYAAELKRDERGRFMK